MVVWWAAAASGAECAAPYALDTLLDDLGALESALASGERMVAASTAMHLRQWLPCLDQPLPQPIASQTLRALGAGLAIRRDPEALGWLRSSAALAPDHRFSEDHLLGRAPLFALWEAAVEAAGAPPDAIEDRVLIEGEHWLDGVAITLPIAHSGGLHLYQLRAAGERGLEGHVIVGAAFPPEVLVIAAAPSAPAARDLDALVPLPAAPDDPPAFVEIEPSRGPLSGSR